MDLSKVKNDEKLRLCQWYFKAGFALLPFVWFVNSIWFFNEAFRKPPYDEQKLIRKYVTLSAIGAFIWTIILSAWIYIFQTNRVAWEEFGDYISCLIPTGRA